MGNVIAYLIVAMIVLWSCYVVLRRFMPKSSFAAQQRFALWLSSVGLTSLGNRLLPKLAQSGCSAGCSDCSVPPPKNKTSAVNSSCAVSAQKQSEQAQAEPERPVQWRS